MVAPNHPPPILSAHEMYATGHGVEPLPVGSPLPEHEVGNGPCARCERDRAAHQMLPPPNGDAAPALVAAWEATRRAYYVAAARRGDRAVMAEMVEDFDQMRRDGVTPAAVMRELAPAVEVTRQWLAEGAAVVARVDLSGLVSDLLTCKHHLAARLVRDGHRHYAALLAAEIRGGRNPDPLADQILAWGEGRDAAIVASNLAWERCGCELCALAALASGDENTRCADCAEDVAASTEGA